MNIFVTTDQSVWISFCNGEEVPAKAWKRIKKACLSRNMAPMGFEVPEQYILWECKFPRVYKILARDGNSFFVTQIF